MNKRSNYNDHTNPYFMNKRSNYNDHADPNFISNVKSLTNCKKLKYGKISKPIKRLKSYVNGIRLKVKDQASMYLPIIFITNHI